jgi:hypothetical protein
VDGSLRISPMLRTLDELNVGNRSFLQMVRADLSRSTWSFAGHELSISRDSILFVHELDAPPRSAGRGGGGSFTRSTLRLNIGGYTVEGFLHVPRGGSALKRLNQLTHPFFSLTSVSVLGADSQFATPFLAVNHARILAAQESVAPDSTNESGVDEPDMSFELSG